MAEGTLQNLPKVRRRCSECGHDAASDKSVRVGFWHDPTRWMVAVFAAILIGVQFSTVWFVPGWFRQQTPTIAHRYDIFYDFDISLGRLTWNDVRNAASQPGPERDRISEQCRRTLGWSDISDTDPAANVVVADGWVSSPRVYERQEKVVHWGFPSPWLWVREVDSAPFSLMGSYPSSMLQVSWASAKKAGIWYDAWIFTSALADKAARCLLMVWLAAKMSRPIRVGFPRSGLRKHWVRIALLITLVLACLPTLPQPSAYQNSRGGGVSWSMTPGASADSGLSLNDIRDAAESRESAAAFAKQLLAARDKMTMFSLLGKDGNHIAVASLISKTTTSITESNFGWPGPFLKFTQNTNGTPVGVAPTPGRFRWNSSSIYGHSFTFNAQAWPGQVTTVTFSFYELLPSAMLTALLCWLLRALLRTHLFFRKRRRTAASQCTHCGYDLKGLRPTAST